MVPDSIPPFERDVLFSLNPADTSFIEDTLAILEFPWDAVELTNKNWVWLPAPD